VGDRVKISFSVPLVLTEACGKDAMSTSVRRRYIISAHPYLFDVRFNEGRTWNDAGEVKLQVIAGGVHEAHALIEADHEGYEAIKAAGFTIEEVATAQFAVIEDQVADFTSPPQPPQAESSNDSSSRAAGKPV
jgi:hypothetical protein